jgi:predicted aspartyl protease
MRISFLFSFLFSCSFAFSANAQMGNPELKSLLDSNELFLFRTAFEAQKSTLAETELHYFSAWNESCFGSTEASNAHIDFFFRNDILISEKLAGELLQLRMENSFRAFRYREADSVCAVLLQHYTGSLTDDELAEVKNFAGIVKALAAVPAQTVARSGDISLPYKRDMAKLIRLDVSIGGKTEDFIFDTGANLSTICESEAKRMGVRMLNAGFGVGSSSQESVEANLGIADEMKIGGATFRNVIFIVLPDKALKFLGGLYTIKGIIGVPVIAQLGEVRITKDSIFFPAAQTESAERNLGFSANTPFASVAFFGSVHPYVFDTGAGASVLNGNFNRAYSDSLQDAREGSSKVGGAGGVQKISVLKVKNLRYGFGGKTGVIETATVQMNGSGVTMEHFYGIAGQDIFMQAETLIINFDKGFVLMR